jgi:RNA-directed DNA polymerase
MTRQKSDGRVVPDGRRKSVETRGVERREGGKATTVKQQERQLVLPLGTAEKTAAQAEVPDGAAAGSGLSAAACAGPKPRSKERTVAPTTMMMEEVAASLGVAFKAVAANKGAPGPDRQSIEQVKKHLKVVLPALSASLLDGSYRPGDIRRVWIPKSGGGKRGLGIPNVVDRVVQEATRQALEPIFEPTFHDESHGFRPGRGCQTAIAAARRHLEDGYDWLVDIDLEKFFDRVNHQRLMARLAQRVTDRRVLVLIGWMLKAKVVMPDGVKVSTEEGVPQGGPLSPLLSNIVLDELDAELRQRGLRFVRYADDCNIYVRSERAGQRVMASITRFIERRLRLKVNASKSAVSRPEERHFLGFRLRRRPEDGDVEVNLSKRSADRIDTRVRELTPRNWGDKLQSCIDLANEYLRGWIAYFGLCTEEVVRKLHGLDAHIRRRLRAVLLKQWKNRATIVRRFIERGVRRKTAWRVVYEGRKSIWALSYSAPAHVALRNAYFAALGLQSLEDRWQRHPARIVVPVQLQLALGQREAVNRPALGQQPKVPKSRM